MSGPISDLDASPRAEPCHPDPPEVEISESRVASVGSMQVRRALPRRQRRSVGPWCFVDHMGPTEVTEREGIDIGPHPHIGLQTVTWLLDGEVLHRDSLGSEQVIKPGQLNLMTAGKGISHSEEHTGRYAGELHGVQLWVAQPDKTRNGGPDFEHHAELPEVDLGEASATVLIGAFGGATSPARRDTDHVGVELHVRAGGSASFDLNPAYEYAVVVLQGSLTMEDAALTPGHLCYLGEGRQSCELTSGAGARAMLIGGVPFDESILMWWNFVARTRDEIAAAQNDWMAEGQRFGRVDSPLERIGVSAPPWRAS